MELSSEYSVCPPFGQFVKSSHQNDVIDPGTDVIHLEMDHICDSLNARGPLAMINPGYIPSSDLREMTLGTY